MRCKVLSEVTRKAVVVFWHVTPSVLVCIEISTFLINLVPPTPWYMNLTRKKSIRAVEYRISLDLTSSEVLQRSVYGCTLCKTPADCRPALGPTQSPVQCVLGPLPGGGEVGSWL